MAKMIMPDEEMESVEQDDSQLKMEDSPHVNVILAAAVGAKDGLMLAVNIGAMLIAFIALTCGTEIPVSGKLHGCARWAADGKNDNA